MQHQLIGNGGEQSDPLFLFYDLFGDGYFHRVAGCVVNQRVTEHFQPRLAKAWVKKKS
tara:strand:+ start:49 stop:222 length:174 start_codon:yes stop_codon:yes gene_type:complete